MRRYLLAITIVGLLVSLLLLPCEEAVALKPIKVAILDSGSNIAYKEGVSLIDGTVKDYNGHGTLMARIVKEVYPEAELYIIKVIGSDGLAINEEAVILGLEWAIAKDVDVINMSLRLRGSARLHQTIKKAYDKGIVMVAAAGNTDSLLAARNLAFAEDSARQTYNQAAIDAVAYPAKYPEVIAVGALNRNGEVYAASAKGEEVQLYCQGYRGNKAGTSIASAYASGIIAKIISENPDLNIEELKKLISTQR